MEIYVKTICALVLIVNLYAEKSNALNPVEVEEIFQRLEAAEHQIALFKEKENVQQEVINKLQDTVSQQDAVTKTLRKLVDQHTETITELQQTNHQLSAVVANVEKTVNKPCAHPSQAEHKTVNRVTIPLDRIKLPAQHNATLKENTKGITKRLPEQPIAFFARKTGTQSNIGVDQHILFDNVPINKGSGFHPQQGLFIAPQSGLYLISCSLLSLHTSHLPVHANIVHNGNVVARIYAHADVGAVNYDQGSNTVLVEAQQGDEIWLQNFAAISEVYGGYYSTFSGYLLWPY